MKLDERGSFSLEAAIVVPMVILFFSAMLLLNLKVFRYADGYCKIVGESFSEYADVHRKVSSVYDAVENIFAVIFG